MKKILWIGDAPDCPSGFGLATKKIIEHLDYRQKGTHDVTVLGINHRGDPVSVPYGVYAAAPGGDSFGIGRLIWMCDLVEPDVIVMQNDGWNIPAYVQRLQHVPKYAQLPIVASVAVDGKNFQGGWLDGISTAVFWTKFALDESRDGGYAGPATIIPLGVDLTTYYPMEKIEAKVKRGIPRQMDNSFIVGNVNRNQPRKRWDLMVKYFAEWVKTYKIEDAWLFMHTAPTGDTGTDVTQLARYYGVVDRLALVEPPTWYGYSESKMCETYNCFDVYASTTQGEGFGLPALEAMACGVPCLLPDWAALGDWAKRGAWLVPCKTTACGPPYMNVIGGIPDQAAFMLALQRLYIDKVARKNNSDAARECANQPQFRWESVGQQWNTLLGDLLSDKREEVWKDLGRPQEAVQ